MALIENHRDSSFWMMIYPNSQITARHSTTRPSIAAKPSTQLVKGAPRCLLDALPSVSVGQPARPGHHEAASLPTYPLVAFAP
jgi:hypothetical protein